VPATELKLDFISSNWRSLVVEEIDKTEVLLSQQLEIYIFSTLAIEFKTEDAFVVGLEN
jgi:hypothetical protein